MSFKRTIAAAGAAALSAALFSGAWHNKAKDFRLPEVGIEFSVNGPETPNCSTDEIKCVALPDNFGQPYSVKMTEKQDPGFPWRHLAPWNAYSIDGTNLSSTVQDVNLVRITKLTGRVSMKNAGTLDHEPKAYEALKISDQRRKRNLYITPAACSELSALVTRGGRHVIVNCGDNAFDIDMDTLKAEKILDDGRVECATSGGNQYVVSMRMGYASRGIYISPDADLARVIWNGHAIYGCDMSVDGNEVYFPKGSGSKWIYNSRTDAVTGEPQKGSRVAHFFSDRMVPVSR